MIYEGILEVDPCIKCGDPVSILTYKGQTEIGTLGQPSQLADGYMQAQCVRCDYQWNIDDLTTIRDTE